MSLGVSFICRITCVAIEEWNYEVIDLFQVSEGHRTILRFPCGWENQSYLTEKTKIVCFIKINAERHLSLQESLVTGKLTQ